MSPSPPRRALLLLALTGSLAACASPGWSGDVTVIGTTREVLRDGHTQSRADLALLGGDDTVYAIVALEHLGGEYTIDGGETWTSRPGEGGLVTARSRTSRRTSSPWG